MPVRKIVVLFTESGLLDRCFIEHYGGQVSADDFDAAKAVFGAAAGATLARLNAAELARNDALAAQAAAEHERDQEREIRQGEGERTRAAIDEAIAEAVAAERARAA